MAGSRHPNDNIRMGSLLCLCLCISPLLSSLCWFHLPAGFSPMIAQRQPGLTLLQPSKPIRIAGKVLGRALNSSDWTTFQLQNQSRYGQGTGQIFVMCSFLDLVGSISPIKIMKLKVRELVFPKENQGDLPK